jgi:hypothetical protein
MSIAVELKIDLLGLEEYINCFLVSEGVRKGYLFQMINHKEYSIDDPISSIKLKRMNEFFPHLYFLPNKLGVLISTRPYTLDDIETDAKLGEILGFPCELPKDDNKVKYVFDVKIVPFQQSPVSIITFISPNPDPLEYVRAVTQAVRDVLYEDDELINIVKDVTYSSEIVHPTKYFIDRLLDENHKFTEKEIMDIENYSNSTTYKTTLSRINNAGGTTGVGAEANVGLWRSTAAITSITIGGQTGNLSTGSTFTLYGIKGA